MKMRFLFKAGAAIAAVTASLPASAAALLFDFSGPSGTAQFQLDSNPVPDFSRTVLPGSDQFGFNDVAGIFGGVPGTASTISFGTGIIADLNIVAPNLGFTQFSGSTPALFSGTTTAPIFAPGNFVLINPFFGNGSLTISAVSPAIPEPATWAMLLLGFAAIGGALRLSRRKQNVSVSYG